MKKFTDSLIFKLILGIIAGILIGNVSTPGVIAAISTFRSILSGLIGFFIPLIIIGFIAPAIVSLKEDAGPILSMTMVAAYISSIGAAFMALFVGRLIIPSLDIVSDTTAAKEIPEAIFSLDIQPMMPVMTALIAAIVIGLAVIWTKAETFERLLNEFNAMILAMVNKIVINILPVFIATTFAELAYQGRLANDLPVFLKVIVIVLILHFIWLAILYGVGGLVSKTNPMEVLKHYGPAYLTALGTMSSAATLPVSLTCAAKAKTLDPEIRDFVIPIGSNIHLCGSVLTETFFVMVVSQILYGKMPEVSDMVLFIMLLGIFGIAAPGVPGGTVVASLGLITSILGFTDAGTALILSIFALQDSFGTACNITGDGAIALIVTGLSNRVPQGQRRA